MFRKISLSLALAAGLAGFASQASAGYEHHHHHHHAIFVWKDVCYWTTVKHGYEYKKVYFCKKVLVKAHH